MSVVMYNTVKITILRIKHHKMYW